ncbi:MAG: BlaI/MecI/CopY family transcriptional regulator [Vicinamibacteria bacterium]
MKPRLLNPVASQKGAGPSVLGRLETLVMECLWKSEGGMSVRDVTRHLNGPWAYTTIMTTLDRLFKKGLTGREQQGRAFIYRVRLSRSDLGVRALKNAISAIDSGTDTQELAVAALVNAIESHDPAWLDSLDRLVREKKRALAHAKPREDR